MAKLLTRDEGQVAFNMRTLDEATRSRNTLQEQAQFLSFAAGNEDELMSVRFPIILENEPESMKNLEKAIGDAYLRTVKVFHQFNKKNKLIRLVDDLNKDDRKWAEDYFKRNIFPSLSPVTLDKARKANISSGLYILVIAETKDDDRIVGYVEVPAGLDRWIAVPNRHFVIPIEDLIQTHIKRLFKGRKILKTCPFSIIRSSEVYEQSDEYRDPFDLIKHTLKARENSWVTKLEIGTDKKECIKTIRKMVPMEPDTLIFASDMIRLSDLRKLPKEIFREEDLARSFTPYVTWPSDKSLFGYIKSKDRLACHPYESYDDSMVKLIEEAAGDPSVTSIRITLYRVAEKSRIINALLKAADNGKAVTALVELKARFDEKHNMQVATVLREGGVRLIYTKPDIKTHAKVCLITRKEKKGLRIYSVVSTANVHEVTTKMYSDLTYYTADQEIGTELVRFFNLMTSDQEPFKPKHIVFSPHNLRDIIGDEIDHQKKLAKKGKESRIILRCNALTDEGIAEKLLDAADAGVPIDLIIRGACIIQPTKNIRIRSIVGRHLEHARCYIFGAKDPTIMIGSSDLMYRSMNRRYELLVRITEPSIRKRLLKHTEWYLADTENARILEKGYQSHLVERSKGDDKVDVQEKLRREAKKIATEG